MAFKRGDADKIVADIVKKLHDTPAKRRIRCPTCGWQPDSSSRWHCVDTAAPEHFSPGCGTAWNTFETGGRCPGCAHQWHWTACLACGSWAQHEAWYVPEDEPDR